MTIELTDKEALEFAEMIEFYFFQVIRDDDEIDNLDWARNMIRIHDMLAEGEWNDTRRSKSNPH